MNNSAVCVDEHSVTIAGDFLVCHDYRVTFRCLLYLLHKLKSEFESKKLIIRFSDGEPIRTVGFDNVIKLIVDNFSITKENFIVKTQDRSFQSDLATVQYETSGFPTFTVKTMSKYVNDLTLNENAALFGLIYGRYSSERFMLAHYASTELKDYSYVIFHPRLEYVQSELGFFSNFFQEELTWLAQWQNSNGTLISSIPGDISGASGMHQQNHDYKTIYPNFKIEIVVETDPNNKYWLTEKTWKCLYTKKPFLLLAEAGTLELLHSIGFRTFDGIFDESYDKETSLYRRIELIQKEMLRLSNMSEDEQTELFEKLEPIIEYNQNNYHQFINNFYKLYPNDFDN